MRSLVAFGSRDWIYNLTIPSPKDPLDAVDHGFSSHSSLSDHNSVAAGSAAASRYIQRATLPRGTNSLITSGVEYILRVLQAKKITFNSYDLASDEDAKRLWRRKAPLGERQVFARAAVHSNESYHDVSDKQQLPGILIGGTCPGVGHIVR